MTDKTYEILVSKMKEVSELSPQTMGPFTKWYHLVVPYFKSSPWKPLVLGSFASAILAYVFFGASIVAIVSILQHGY